VRGALKHVVSARFKIQIKRNESLIRRNKIQAKRNKNQIQRN